jgi:23S rRNA (guanosine2251-2'-O)-methyltransferase
MRDFHGKGRSPKGHPSKLPHKAPNPQHKGFTPKEPAEPRSKQRYNRHAPRPSREAPKPLQRREMPPSGAIVAAPNIPREDRGGAGRIAGGVEREREIVYGVEPIRELVAAAAGSIRVLYVKSGDERRFANEIDRVRTGGGRVEFADEAGLERMAGLTARHQGIAALMREYEYVPFEAILEQKPDPLVVVDGVTDPRNLGALMRSAEGAGVGALVLARDRTAGITPAAVKSSAGAWIHLKIARCGNVARALEQLKEQGYWIAALAPGGETRLYDLDTTRKLAIVVGSEDRGVRDIVRKGADFVVDIPMRGKVNSLNVSVAAAVALFEIARKRESTAEARSEPTPSKE